MILRRAIGVVGVGIALVGACVPAMAQSASTSGALTTFTFADTSEPSSLNPIVGYEATDYVLWALNYNLPIEFGTQDFGPDYQHSIVTSVDSSSDGMTFAYHVRPGMKWSDGQPFTAHDIAWTLNFYKKYEISNYTADLTYLKEATATDDTTVVITSTQPTSFFSGTSVFMYEYILPEHIWGKYEDDVKAARQFSNVPSVGSGPYIITSYQQGQSVTLERNPYYWGDSVGLTPHYDRLIYSIYTDEDAEAAALQNGEIDFAFFNSANILKGLIGKPHIATRGAIVPLYSHIGVNTGSAYETDTAGGFKPHGDGAHALTDPVVRQAMREAIDDQTIVDKVLLGYGTPADSPVQPTATTGNWDPPPDQALPFDIAAANAKLDAAGYRRGPDGIRIDPVDGEPLEFRYYVRNQDQNTIDTAPFIKDWLGQIGIKIDVSSMSNSKLESEIEAGTYDLFNWDWFPNPDPNYILGIFTCAQRPPRAGVYENSDSYYCNPEYDRLFRAQATETDPAKRTAIVHRMQAILYRDEPEILLFYGATLEAYRTDRVTGFTPQPADSATVKGDLLAGYGPFSFISIRPVSGTSGLPSGGAGPGLWIALVVGLVVVAIVVATAGWRRRRDPDRA